MSASIKPEKVLCFNQRFLQSDVFGTLNENNINNSNENGQGHINKLKEKLITSPTRIYQLTVAKKPWKPFQFRSKSGSLLRFFSRKKKQDDRATDINNIDGISFIGVIYQKTDLGINNIGGVSSIGVIYKKANIEIPHNEPEDFLLGVKEMFERGTTATVEELRKFENKVEDETIKEILKIDRERFIRSMIV